MKTRVSYLMKNEFCFLNVLNVLHSGKFIRNQQRGTSDRVPTTESDTYELIKILMEILTTCCTVHVIL